MASNRPSWPSAAALFAVAVFFPARTKAGAGEAYTLATGAKLATHPAFRLALSFAAERVEDPRCRAIYSEFSDGAGRPLRERLEELHLSAANHLAGLVFEDGDRDPLCHDTGDTIAYTSPLSPVVHVCTSRFVRTMRKNPPFATATVLHEQLHTLGLGENPPSPQQITERVLARCGR